MTAILGISAFYHDSAASIIVDGKIIAAVQEERFTRKKHDPSFPVNSIEYVIKEAQLSMDKIKYVVFYDKPFLKFERLLETYLSFVPKGFRSFKMAMPIWLREKLFLKDLLTKEFKKFDKSFNGERLFFSEHHISHAASAFYPSPYNEAIILCIDGVGEWATTTVSIGRKNKIEMKKEIHFPHSLGLLYSAFTYYTGFKVNSGEYKLMGLAPYGKPIYRNLIFEKLIDLKEDGSFRLDQKYFNYSTGLTMTNINFENLFGVPVRKPDEAIKQFHMDVAASIQIVLEEIILKITKQISFEYKIKNLCLAGGVALNCVANGKILKQNNFKNIWIQPASGDAGGSLGCALYMWYGELEKKRQVGTFDSMQGSYLGPLFNDVEIEKRLRKSKAIFKKIKQDKLIKSVAKEISNGKSVGWFQGRMEFGPRALGSRSILADPRSDKMQKNLNLKIKFRESFRPFAPSILSEKVSDWFELNSESQYMLIVSNVKKNKCVKMTDKETKLFGIDKLNIKRSLIPAVTHVDYSARIQTVHKETNLIYHKLINEFFKITGVPILVNTSFNVRGEPIVCFPEDAFRCFMGTGLDILVIGNYFLKKDWQDKNLSENYENKYELD